MNRILFYRKFTEDGELRNMHQDELANRVKEIVAKLPEDHIAKGVKMSQSRVSTLERGDRPMRSSEMIVIAMAFGLDDPGKLIDYSHKDREFIEAELN
jgi:hypothetical protein